MSRMTFWRLLTGCLLSFSIVFSCLNSLDLFIGQIQEGDKIACPCSSNLHCLAENCSLNPNIPSAFNYVQLIIPCTIVQKLTGSSAALCGGFDLWYRASKNTN
jgi:hypothetical protein